jgi:hypothetical protein
MLLENIRQVFDARRVDRIISQILVDELVALEGAPWSEWRGRAGIGNPAPLRSWGCPMIVRCAPRFRHRADDDLTDTPHTG